MKHDHSQPHFDALLPKGKIWFNTNEVAALLGRTGQFVRDCCDTGRLHGHRITSYQSTGKLRYTYQFHRDALQLFLLETATYEADEFIDRLAALIHARSVPEARAIFRRAGVLLSVLEPEQAGGASPPPPRAPLPATGTC
ncbi:hypothetical protein [Cerasicoccus frondis]|uniref:hypothetical protein n=1 Tax=Cerasicoccus frondis TaxID=490090 RepID=UPI0028525BA3|nr:hypothetical protein [Cerasicoccus frondis]